MSRSVSAYGRQTLLARFSQSWVGRHIAQLLVAAAFVSAMLTFAAITGNARFGTAFVQVSTLLWINLGLFVIMAVVVLRRIVVLWRALRRGAAGSRLQTRIVTLFSIVTIAPTLVVSVFSALFFNLGVQAWFNDRIKTALFESQAVAESYLHEHMENIRGDVVAIASELNRTFSTMVMNPADLNQFIETQEQLRSLTEVLVFQKGRVLAQGRFSFALLFEQLPSDVIERAAEGGVVIIAPEDGKVRALVRLESIPGAFLLIGRLVDSRVIGHMEKTQGAVNEYRQLKGQLGLLQRTFSVMFLALSLLLLLASVWYGMVLAGSLIRPVTELVLAAERVRAGDFSAKVEAGEGQDELSTLGRVFNRMTDQLQSQRTELIEANRHLDERRRFTETVVSGVSAGVVALDSQKRISLINRTAAGILLTDPEENSLGRNINEILPGLAEDIAKAEQNPGEVLQTSMGLERGGKMLTLHVRISVEHLADVIEGFIITFDDITVLVAAQRNAAWADVARRIAHEIKNPLTPIQLAAERLKRKYLKFIEPAESENFVKYTDTIARHVGDIGKMVEEFVSFARMPTPVFSEQDVAAIVRAAIFSQQCAHPSVEYVPELPQGECRMKCDERQLTQVLTNLLKNAAEAIEGSQQEHGKPERGRIRISLADEEPHITLSIIDNGPGFPPGQAQKMLEPYVTTRAKGTGLGLAIVKKITEDHKGLIFLDNSSDGGAKVTLSFSK